jgi:hypothetical protein
VRDNNGPVAIEDDLIWYVTWKATAAGSPAIKTRLIKLLYLVDLAHSAKTGRPATGLRWYYHRHGPYATGVEDSLDHMVGRTLSMESTSTAAGGEAMVLRARTPPPPDLLPARLAAITDEVLARWARVELSELLAHVYFETGPMRGAERGDDLDLTDSGRWPPDYHPLTPPVLPDGLRAELDDWFERCRAAMPRVTLAARPRSDDEYEALMGAGQLSIAPGLAPPKLRLSAAFAEAGDEGDDEGTD